MIINKFIKILMCLLCGYAFGMDDSKSNIKYNVSSDIAYKDMNEMFSSINSLQYLVRDCKDYRIYEMTQCNNMYDEIFLLLKLHNILNMLLDFCHSIYREEVLIKLNTFLEDKTIFSALLMAKFFKKYNDIIDICSSIPNFDYELDNIHIFTQKILTLNDTNSHSKIA